MRPRYLSVLLATLALLAGCSALTPAAGPTQALGTAAVPAAPADESAPTISVSASGDVEAEPDLAVVRLAVEHTADSADEARQRVADDVATMRDALREAGVPDENVSTDAFAIHVQYDSTPDGREVDGYRAVHAFRVEVAPDAAGEVIDAAVENGATRVGGVQFTLSEDRTRALRADALAEAMADARSDADALASAADVSIVGVHSVSTSDGPVVPFTAETRADAAAGAPTVLEPGTVTVTAQVRVVYAIE
jgi:hypothetical protein